MAPRDSDAGSELRPLRRSTIEVHPKKPEAPHLALRSFIPHPKTDFHSKNQIASRRIIPWPEFGKLFLFEIKIWAQGTRSLRKKNSGNVLPLSWNGSTAGGGMTKKSMTGMKKCRCVTGHVEQGGKGRRQLLLSLPLLSIVDSQ